MKKYLILLVSVSFLFSCATNNKKTKKLPTKSSNNKNFIPNVNKNDEGFYLSQGDLYDKNNKKINKIFYFALNSYLVPERYVKDIKKHVKYIKKSGKNFQIRIEGHTDERGSREYNLALGGRRGRSVAKILKNKGINDFEVISYGEEKPLDDGNDQYAWSRNRRAEIIYYTE